MKTRQDDVLLAYIIHYLRGSCEQLLRRSFDHFLLSDQLLNGQNDLLYVFDPNLDSMAEILLKNIFCRGLHHH